MTNIDPWAGMVDPRAALKAAREAAKTLAGSSRMQPKACESDFEAGSKVCTNSSSSSNFSCPSLTLSQSSGEKPKDRKETCSSSLSMVYANPDFSSGLLDPERCRSGEETPARAARPLERDLSHSDDSRNTLAATCESFAVVNTVPSPTAHLQGPHEWRAGLERLNREAPPCPGFRTWEWEEIERVVRHFMDHCAADAAARGWTALDLFGVHRTAGAAAVDSCGALMLPGTSVATVIRTDAITFGHLVYRKRPMPLAMPVWDFVGADQRTGEAA